MKVNCWEFMKCGREPTGSRAGEIGVCPVAVESKCQGVNDGLNGGRVCWIVGGTLCGGEIQGSFAHKVQSCLQCEFFELVRREQGSEFEGGATVLPSLCDTTQIVRAYEQLSAAYEELIETRMQLVAQERLALIGETIAGLAHCLSGTLNALRAGQYVIDRAFELQDMEKLTKGWDVMKSGVRQVEQLAYDMLYYIKDRIPERTYCNCNEIIGELILLLSSTAAGDGVQLRAELDEEVGKRFMDRTAVYRALLNLTTNAVAACLESETGNLVVLRSRAAPDGVELSVTDNGIGMSDSVRNQLFTRFFSTKNSKGTGLGLLVTKKIAEEHGGSISVASEPGKGSTFSIHIPGAAEVEQAKVVETSTPADASPEPRPPRWVSGKAWTSPPDRLAENRADPRRVLIVDDGDDDVLYLSQILEDHGIQYRIASNGVEALAAMRDDRPDLVLLDVMMPRKSGLVVLNEMKADPTIQALPVIVITGACSVTGVDLTTGDEQPKTEDGDGFLRAFGGTLHDRLAELTHANLFAKPVDPLALVQKIEELLPVEGVAVRGSGI